MQFRLASIEHEDRAHGQHPPSEREGNGGG
jgi:hypothetical protein